MKAGKITAKLRDAVKVCLVEEGKERTRYRNIDLPDAIKELEIKAFNFDVHLERKIDFQLHFDKGILPEVFPPIREKGSRKHKEATTATNAPQTPDTAAKPADAATLFPNLTQPQGARIDSMVGTVTHPSSTPGLKPEEAQAQKPIGTSDAKPAVQAKPEEKKGSKPAAKSEAATPKATSTPAKPTIKPTVKLADKPAVSQQEKK